VRRRREKGEALTDVGHAIISSHHTVHLLGIGVGESFEVLSNTRQQYLVLVVLDAAIVKCGRGRRHVVCMYDTYVISAVYLSQEVLQSDYGC